MSLAREHLVMDIKQVSDNIRKKISELRNTSVRKQRSFETRYRPLIEPLRTLTRKVEPAPVPKVAQVQTTYLTDYTTDDEELTSLDTDPVTLEQVENIEDYIESQGIGGHLGSYLKFIQSDTKGEADFTYGVHYDGDKWMMGRMPIQFSANTITINDVKYEITDGLCELIFKKIPKGYDEDDLNTYKRMLLHTNSHVTEDGIRIKSNRGYKYKNIISKLFPYRGRRVQREGVEPSTSSQSIEGLRKRKGEPLLRRSKEKRGEGLLVQVNKEPPIDYKSWTDPNILIDRLYLLLASKKAGNTGHDEEILKILQELKNAGYIKDFDSFKL